MIGRISVTILYVEDDDFSAAQALQSVVTGEPILKFDASNPLRGDAIDITLVAQTKSGVDTIAGKTPEELATDFSTIIDERGKAHLQDLYLISSEAGICKADRPSYAQRFAAEMKTRGFQNLKVHAVANPIDQPTAGMHVEIIENSEKRGEKKGQLNVLLYEDEYSMEIDTQIRELTEKLDTPNLEAEEKGRIQEDLQRLRQDTNCKTNNLLSTANYKETLREPYYTFTAKGPKATINNCNAYAIYYLQAQRTWIKNNYGYDLVKQNKYLTYTNHYIERIQKNSTRIKENLIDYLKNHGDWLERNFLSTYYKKILKPLIDILETRKKRLSHTAIVTNGQVYFAPSKALGTYSIFLAGYNKSNEAEVASTERSKELLSVIPIKATLMPRGTALSVDDTQNIGHHSPPPSLPATSTDTDTELTDTTSTIETDYDEKKEKRKIFMKSLYDYRAVREWNEWEFMFNFLCFKSFFFFFTDCFRGTDYYKSKSRELKLSAVNNLVKIMEGRMVVLSHTEICALKDGRLGKIIASYDGGLDQILRDHPPALQTDQVASATPIRRAS